MLVKKKLLIPIRGASTLFLRGGFSELDEKGRLALTWVNLYVAWFLYRKPSLNNRYIRGPDLVS